MSSTAGVTGADFTAIPPNGNPAGVANSPFSDFPQAGTSFAILSSGDAVHVDPAATADAGENGSTEPTDGPRAGVNDLNTLHVNLAVPESANCALVSFRFLTDEEPGAEFNDGFIAELDTDDWSIVPATGTDPSRIEAPHNFAFDANGDVISVNSPGSASLTPEGATNTGLANGTARLTAATPVTPGAHSLYLSVFDFGDDIVDSAVLLDDLRLENRAAGDCTAGVVPDDTTAPAVRITSPFDHGATDDTTPVISGTAGSAPGDSFEVRVALRSGATVLQNLTAERSGTAWSVQTGALAPGDYTLVASQSDDAGNVGTSPAITFTVNAPPPPPDDDTDTNPPPVEPPAPVQGQSVVAGKVSGTIRIRLKNGKFRTLGANESIPLGSTDRRHQGPRAADLGGRRRQDPDRRLLQGPVQDHADQGQEADHPARAQRHAELWRQGVSGGQEEEEGPQPVGRRQGALPHQGPPRGGDRARHQVVHAGHVHQHEDHGQARRRPGPRLRQAQERDGQEGPLVRGPEEAEVAR